MPWEIGEFRHQCRLHRLTLSTLSSNNLKNITLLPTLNLNDKIIDWENSKLPKEYYIEHFKISCNTLKDIINVTPRIGKVISTTETLKKNIEDILTEQDYYLWIDPDISYSYNYWDVLLEAFEILSKNDSTDMFFP